MVAQIKAGKKIELASLRLNEIATQHSKRRQQTLSSNFVQFNEEIINGQIKELVRGNVEETLNKLLEAEAEKQTPPACCERNEAHQGYRNSHYDWNLTTISGDVTLHVPRLKGTSLISSRCQPNLPPRTFTSNVLQISLQEVPTETL